MYYPDEYSPYTLGNKILRRGLPFIGAPSRRVRLVKRFLKGGRILDVGCGSGVFLEVLGAQGWHRHAMDIADHSLLQDQNVPFFAGHFDAQPPPVHSLDAVTLWHVFEHLYHPQQALRNAHAILKPGGYLFLAVPDHHCLDRHLFGRAWIGWDPPRHLATYSRKSMEILLRRANFQLQAVLPDAINGSTVALCCDFALRSKGIHTERLWSSLPVHLALTPWSELTRLAGVAQAKVYVATRTH
jgi:SAM-dependent methyltransferase